MSVIEDPYDKIEKAQERYRKSEKGRGAQKRYNQTLKRKETRDRYFKSELGQKALLRYYLSEKAKTTRQQRQALLKLFRRLDKYLKENSEKTIEDYFKQLKPQEEE